MTKRYSRHNKKHSFDESLIVLSDFYIDLLSRKFHLMGEYIEYPWGKTWSAPYTYRELRIYARHHWWRGNQR